jgi:hypothetical protein
VESLATTLPVAGSRADRAARAYVQEWRQTILTGFWALVTGNKDAYQAYQKEYLALFNEPTEEEIQNALAAIPANMRWWDVAPREVLEREQLLDCFHCGEGLRGKPVKVCPQCKVVLHATCFDEAEGGYETPHCECCRNRVGRFHTLVTPNFSKLVTTDGGDLPEDYDSPEHFGPLDDTVLDDVSLEDALLDEAILNDTACVEPTGNDQS